jgi:hypothetical protein
MFVVGQQAEMIAVHSIPTRCANHNWFVSCISAFRRSQTTICAVFYSSTKQPASLDQRRIRRNTGDTLVDDSDRSIRTHRGRRPFAAERLVPTTR